MICIPSRQLGLIQNKLCGQKQFERAAKGEVACASNTGEKISSRWEEGCSLIRTVCTNDYIAPFNSINWISLVVTSFKE